MGIVPGTPWCGVLILKLHCEEQLEIVILALLHILTLCKCDSFPWVNTSKFHSLWEEKWVPNPPVTHSQILKLHLLVKKNKPDSSTSNPMQTQEQVSTTWQVTLQSFLWCESVCWMFPSLQSAGERMDYTKSLRVRNRIHKTARGAHSATLLLRLGRVIISHCYNLDYIPKGIKWKMFY